MVNHNTPAILSHNQFIVSSQLLTMLPDHAPSNRPLRQFPVLIVGDGIAGLVLAQALKKL